MPLVLEVEYLAGVAFAAVGPDSSAPDWPPQPDRIFSALVASWAARGQDPGEAEALEWLEALPAPRILASGFNARTPATVFVPPNDPRSDKKKHAKGVLPALRSRKERRFPAARPHDPVVRLFWDCDVSEEGTLSRLQRLASDTAYVGHSASLTRCRFLAGHELSTGDAVAPARGVYAGRFAELRRSFDAGRRPRAGQMVLVKRVDLRRRMNVFGDRWLLFEHVAGDMPDPRASALVAKCIRNALLSAYERIGLGDAIPEIVSGHSLDGSASATTHIAVVPLPYAGFQHADGHVMGFALVPPHGCGILDDEDFRRALRAIAPVDESRGRRILMLASPADAPKGTTAFSIELSPSFEPPTNKLSLDPKLWARSGRSFATVMPIVLDRHLKRKGAARQIEIETQIAGACSNVGLPEPEAVVADKHSAMEGAPSAYPSARSPAWMRWRLPSSLASRQLTHAVIRFPQEVDGPVILGAGRFVGLGLCRAIGESRERDARR